VEASGYTFVFELINFLLLAAALTWLCFRPVRAFIRSREEELRSRSEALALERGEVEQELEKARLLRAEAEAALDRQRSELAETARAEQERLTRALRERAETEHARLAKELEAKRTAELEAWSRDVAEWTTALTQALLGRVKGPTLTHALILRAGRELRELRERGALVDPVFEVAEPLDAGHRALLADAAGCNSEQLQVRLVPELVAGVRLVSAQGVIDASVRGLAEYVGRSLRHSAEAMHSAAPDSAPLHSVPPEPAVPESDA